MEAKRIRIESVDHRRCGKSAALQVRCGVKNGTFSEEESDV